MNIYVIILVLPYQELIGMRSYAKIHHFFVGTDYDFILPEFTGKKFLPVNLPVNRR